MHTGSSTFINHLQSRQFFNATLVLPQFFCTQFLESSENAACGDEKSTVIVDENPFTADCDWLSADGQVEAVPRPGAT